MLPKLQASQDNCQRTNACCLVSASWAPVPNSNGANFALLPRIPQQNLKFPHRICQLHARGNVVAAHDGSAFCCSRFLLFPLLSHAGGATMVEHRLWLDNRRYKDGNTAPCRARWLTAPNCASPTAQNYDPTSMDQVSTEHLWQEYSTPLWDNGCNEHNLDPPNVSHRSTMDPAWTDNLKTPKCVKQALGRKTDKTRSYSAGSAGDTTHKKPRLSQVKEIHAHMLENGNDFLLFQKNTLMGMYVKCGSLVDARQMFDHMPNRDVVSWNVMILGHAKQEEGVQALELYAQMHQESVQPSHQTFVAVLKACCSLAAREEGKKVDGKLVKIRCLEKGRAIHSQAVKSGFVANVFVGTTLVDLYAKCGSMEDAKYAFDQMPHRDVVSWTLMILGHAQKEEGAVALELYAQMHQEGVQPNDRTFVAALKACNSLTALEKLTEVDVTTINRVSLEKGRAIHSQVVESVFDSDVFVVTTLVDLYAKCGSMEDARHIFDEFPHHDVVSWTAMISGYVQKEESELALELYARMYQEGCTANDRTFVSALKACSSLAAHEEVKQVDGKFVKVGCLEKGRGIHSHAVLYGFESNIFVGTILVDMYAKCGRMDDASHVFYKLPHRDVVSWNAMISGYALNEEGELALDLYAQMEQEGVIADDRTFVSALNACSSLAAQDGGKQLGGNLLKVGCLEKCRAIHSQALKSGYESDVFVGTTLLDLYVKCGSMKDARYVFEELPHRNMVSWNAMISGYVVQEESDEALKHHAQMQEHGLSANSFTFVSSLKACGNKGALEIGKELHAQICKFGLETTAIVANTLIDMYAKCGSMADAQQLFDTFPIRDFTTCNALIAGYARQGESELVFHLFERMRQEAIQPDGVTFLCILTACSHAGLVDKGQMYFQAMSKRYGIVQTIEHYTCMIDLLGRAGQVQDALAMVENMPFEPDVVVWFSLLGACQKWNNVNVGRHAFEHVVRLDEINAAAYVLMSNIYAHAQMWEDCDEIQAMRRNSQSMEKPGRSWADID